MYTSRLYVDGYTRMAKLPHTIQTNPTKNIATQSTLAERSTEFFSYISAPQITATSPIINTGSDSILCSLFSSKQECIHTIAYYCNNYKILGRYYSLFVCYNIAMKATKNFSPLAENMRPKSLADVVGQEHIVAKNQFLHSVINSAKPVSLILWGPPGSGKTTLARIIGGSGDFEYIEISAVTSGIADVKKVIQSAKEMQSLGRTTVLFVDEIHRFNKSQQDAFLPHVENGTIILIGATTENPSFEVIGPLLSRSRVVVLDPLSETELVTILERAAKQLTNKTISTEATKLLAKLAGGDARVALNGLEVASQISAKKITPSDVKLAMQTTATRYDKSGEYHYNLISAYIKSMRGSDVDATLYYLARMINVGEDPKFIARRNIVFASEDIGIAAPAALSLAVSTFLAVERIGVPECNYNLFECAVVLAKSKKSRAVADAMNKSFEIAKQHPDSPVPLHLRNAPTKLMKDLGYQKGTKWEAGFKHTKGFLPDDIKDITIYND